MKLFIELWILIKVVHALCIIHNDWHKNKKRESKVYTTPSDKKQMHFNWLKRKFFSFSFSLSYRIIALIADLRLLTVYNV